MPQPASPSDNGIPSSAPALLWETLTTEPGVSVSILDQHGTILFLNAETVRIFFDANPPPTIKGFRLDQLGFPKAWVDERLALFRDMIQDPGPRLMRTVWHGLQQFSWVRMIPAEVPGGSPSFLVITRRISAGEESKRLLAEEHAVIKSAVIRLGDLDVLTPRELEVLTLLGHGLAIKDIAESLERSVKTIERHREAIGAKLRLSKAVVLAQLARDAGLVLGDAARRRV
jgi:DNA-binding CsgD family transcriptional regulator